LRRVAGGGGGGGGEAEPQWDEEELINKGAEGLSDFSNGRVTSGMPLKF
jgi:hypothetical protein